MWAGERGVSPVYRYTGVDRWGQVTAPGRGGGRRGRGKGGGREE